MKKRVTIKNIAEKLGLSMMTVSRAINSQPYVDEETKAKVLKVANRLGYFPNHIAKSLVEKKTYTIGVVVPEITHSFFPMAIKGIEEAASKAHYQIILTHSAEDAQKEIKALQTLIAKRVDGLLVSVAEGVYDYQIYKKIMRLGLPIVFFDRCVPEFGISCVSIDDVESAKKITEHLILLGHKRIAHLNGPLRVSIGKARLQGYKKALRQYNCEIIEELIVESGFHEEGGYAAMKKLFELPKEKQPDAIVAVNDPAAFGAIKCIIENNYRIPEDIAIVGFSDDIRAELISPSLTTVRQPAYEIGKKAAQKLIAHIENSKEKVEEIIIETEQIIRHSSGEQFGLLKNQRK